MVKVAKKLMSRPTVVKAVAAFLGTTVKTIEATQAAAVPEEPIIVVDGIDITIPKFLRRTTRLTPVQIKYLTSKNIPWAPFKKKGETDMAKINTVIVNREAPVEVNMRDARDNTKQVCFANMDEFEAWYNPKHHHFIGGRTSEKYNLIGIDVKSFDDATSKKPAISPAKPGDEKPAKPSNNARGGKATVWADGKEHGSVPVAFTTLRLPMNKMKKFRSALKAARKLDFIDGKRTVKFEYRP